MRCYACSAELPVDASNCPRCQAPMGASCPSCMGPLPPSARFCLHCREPQEEAAQEGERRHLTVMFSDLVGSTQISGIFDEEPWGRVIGEYHRLARTVVSRYEGRVAQLLGDGVLAYSRWHDRGREPHDRRGRLERSRDTPPRECDGQDPAGDSGRAEVEGHAS